MNAQAQVVGAGGSALSSRPLHLAIGIFDGVHLGHRAVVESAVSSARQCGGAAAVLTFDPHPSRLFRPESPTRLLLDAGRRAQRLLSLGVDAVITQPFTAEYASMEAEAFLPGLRRQLPTLAAVYVGENWRFGHGRRGDVAMLLASGQTAGVHVFSAPRVNLDGEPISSSRIRALLERGELARANSLLGYNYGCAGVVTPGRQLGRTIGFPTLNIPWAPELVPCLGVYVVRVRAPGDGDWLPAVANYGARPTVETGAEPRLEVHLLADCPFFAGAFLEVEWLRFLRPERRFESLDALRLQLKQDCEAARAEFSLH